MSISYSENPTHRDACQQAETTRQAAVGVAGGDSAAIKAADIAFYRTCLASAIANNCDPGSFTQVLRELGAGAG